jgi:hypothetical protein
MQLIRIPIRAVSGERRTTSSVMNDQRLGRVTNKRLEVVSLSFSRGSSNAHLITDCAGFIGSHLVEALVVRRHDVVIYDNLDPRVHGETPNRTLEVQNAKPGIRPLCRAVTSCEGSGCDTVAARTHRR